MLDDMLDLPVTARTTVNQVIEIINSLGGIHLLVLVLSVLVTVLILTAHWLVPRWPVPLFVVVGTLAQARHSTSADMVFH
jgi:MFS superfamily sulfate permease-like transporter